jgi:hypothetical protein
MTIEADILTTQHPRRGLVLVPDWQGVIKPVRDICAPLDTLISPAPESRLRFVEEDHTNSVPRRSISQFSSPVVFITLLIWYVVF